MAAFICFGVAAGQAQVNVTTYHNDNARSAQNLSETLLTPANVNAAQFGKLFTQPVDGYIYAQPLYVANLQIAGGTHNVVFAATENDSVFAFDADSNVGAGANPLWQVSFINPAAGITTVSAGDVTCEDLTPQMGITGTPVIDPASNTLYVVAKTKENGAFFQRLHALDLATGAEKFGGPVVIQATVPGSGDASAAGQISFDPQLGNQRPGLLLQNGLVYIAWSSHCDYGPYHGWVMAYNAQTLQQTAVWADTANGALGGIWQSGGGPAADTSGNVFLATGNGTFDLNKGGPDAGDSIVKLGAPSGSQLPVLDYFTPYNQNILSINDQDLGAGGVMLLPDLPPASAHRQLLVGAGKQGTIYVVDRNSMGGYNASGNKEIVQTLPGSLNGLFGTPAFWNNTLYFGGAGDSLRAFSFNANNSGLLSASPVSYSTNSFGYPGTSPSISANANTNGIVWAVQVGEWSSSGAAVLYAYDATNLATELYNSTQNSQDAPGPAVKFSVPTIANGKVYVATETQLAVYGIKASLPAAPTLVSPGNGATGVSLTPTLTWSAAAGATGYNVYLGTSSPPPLETTTTDTSYSPTVLNEGATYYWEVAAQNSYSLAASPVWSFSTVTCPPVLSPASFYLDSTSQSATLNVTAAPDCAWSASPTGGFITIASGGSGPGSAALLFSVPANVTGADLSGSLAIGAQTVPVTERATATVFTDVGPPDYDFDFANLIYGDGITAGCSPSPLDFCPNETVTRDQMAVFLVTAVEGGNNFTYTATPYFTDVPPSGPFFEFIQKLKDLGITNGCSATEFCPDNPVTRGEMAAFIIRARYETTPFGYPSTPYFTDVPSTDQFFTFIQKMAQTGITAGCSATLFCPDNNLNRGQAAVFIVTGLLNQLLPAGTPIISTAAPNSTLAGQTVTVTLTGVNTHFAEGTTQVTAAPGITPSNIAVTSGTSMTVQLAVDPGAAPNPYSIVVITGTEEAVLPNGFTVLAPP